MLYYISYLTYLRIWNSQDLASHLMDQLHFLLDNVNTDWYLRDRLSQEFYKQGFGITSKIWFLCTLEFTVHSALFEPVWFVIVLRVSTQHFLFRFSISSLRSISSLPCLQTARNKAECTVNSKVQKDQILGATPYPCRRQL